MILSAFVVLAIITRHLTLIAILISTVNALINLNGPALRGGDDMDNARLDFRLDAMFAAARRKG